MRRELRGQKRHPFFDEVQRLEAISKMLKQAFDAAEPDETEEVAEVGEQPFDFPTPFVPPEFSTVLDFKFFAVHAVWSDHVDVLFGQREFHPQARAEFHG